MSSSAPRLPVLVLLTAGSIAIGFLVGRSQSEPEPARPSEINARTPSTSAAVATASATDTAADETRAGLSLNAFRERLNEIGPNRRFGIRRYQYKRLFESMTAEEAPAIFAELRDNPGLKDRITVMHFFFLSWGELDGAAATEAALSLDGRDRASMTGNAIGGWAKTNPDRAWEEAVALAQDWPAFASQTGRVIGALAQRDLMDAITRRSDIPGPRGDSAVQRAIVNHAAQEGQLGTVLNAVMAFDDVEAQKRWISSIFSSWGGTEADAPLTALSAISDPTLAQSAMTGFLNGWAGVDPLGAVDYALTHREEPMVASSLGRVVQQALVGGDRERTLELVERVAALGELDRIGPRIVGSVASTDPQIALRMGAMFADEGDRRSAAVVAMSRWVQRDFAAASAHFEQMPPGQLKIAALSPLATRALQRADVGRTIRSWVESFPDGNRGQAVEVVLDAANLPHMNLTAAALETVRTLVRETPGLSEPARRYAEKIGAAEVNAARE